MAISDSGSNIIFEVLDADPLDISGRSTPSSDDQSSENEPLADPVRLSVEQQEQPEIQQSQEEDADAPSAKVVSSSQPPDLDNFEL